MSAFRPIVRPATPADIPQVYDIWYKAEIDDASDPPPPGEPALLRHELESGEMYVVEQAGQVAAFTALLSRSGISFLAELFVRAEFQSAGLGQRLLRQVLPQDGRLCCTLSSADPRALALYIRLGLRPAWSHFVLRASINDISLLPQTGIVVEEALAGDPELIGWDAALSGRYRPADHAYWLDHTGAIPLWFRREGRTIGYGYAQTRSLESLWYPQAITLGPIGARTAADAAGCVYAAVRWAQLRTDTLLIAVPGPHPALAALLEAHFRITYVETFVSTSEPTFIDPRCYIAGSSTIF